MHKNLIEAFTGILPQKTLDGIEKAAEEELIRNRFEAKYGHRLDDQCEIVILNHGAGSYSIQQGKNVISVSKEVIFGK